MSEILYRSTLLRSCENVVIITNNNILFLLGKRTSGVPEKENDFKSTHVRKFGLANAFLPNLNRS